MDNSRRDQWIKKLFKTREITMLLRAELLDLNGLYRRLTDIDLKIHDFDRENDLTFTFVAGEEIDTDTSQNYKIQRDRQEMVELKQQIEKPIELLTMRRQALISSEISEFRRKEKFMESSSRRRSFKRGCMSHTYEVRSTL